MKRFLFLPLIAVQGLATGADDSLGRGIPSDSFLYFRWRSGPGGELPSKEAAKLGAAAREAFQSEGFVELFLGLLGQSAAPQETAQWRKLLAGIDWGTLLGKEIAFGLRFDLSLTDRSALDAMSQVDWIALFRVDPAERDRILSSLRKAVLAFSTLEEKSEDALGRKTTFEVIDGERDGVPTSILITRYGESRLCLSGGGGAIALGSSTWVMRRSLKLLSGEGSGLGIVDLEEGSRLKGPGPEDPTSGGFDLLFRPSLPFGQLDSIAREVEKAPLRDENLVEGADQVVRILRGIVESLDIIRTVMVRGTIDGGKLVETIRIELQESASRRGFFPAFFGRPAAGDLGRLVPRDASGFALTAGVDPEKLLDAAVDFIRKVMPDGRLLIDEFRRDQEKAGFDLKRDLLSLFEGRAILLKFPPRARPGEGESSGSEAWDDRVLLLRLRDPSRAEAKLGEWIGKSPEYLKPLGIEEVGMEGIPGTFRRLTLPFPPGLEITFGVSDGDLALGTSRERIREAFLIRGGKAESILSSQRFLDLGLPAGGEPGIIAFSDLRDSLREARLGLKGLGLLSTMIPEGQKGSATLFKTFLRFAPHLDALLGALEFASQGGGYLARDEKGYAGKYVVTFGAGGPASGPTAPPGEGEKKAVETKRRTF